MDYNKIYCHDCITGMQQLDEKTVDLIITSPPYNVTIDYDGYADDMSLDDYLDWSKKWMGECFRVLKDGGRFCLNVADILNREESGPYSIYLGKIALDIGFQFYSKIIWVQNDVFNATSWGSWESASCPAFLCEFENVLVFYKTQKKTIEKGEDDIKAEEFKEWVRCLWNIAPDRRKLHPAPFPVSLPYRLIKLLSFKDAIILDPFMGSGTTALASKMLERRYIGFDTSEEYCKIAKKRVDSFVTLRDWW